MIYRDYAFVKVKIFKFLVDIAIAILLFIPAYLDLSWLPHFVQDLIVDKSNEQKPSEDTPILIYWVLMAYSTTAIAKLRKIKFPLIKSLVERKGGELVRTLTAAIGVLVVLTVIECLNGRENAILLGLALMAAYSVFLYSPIWIGNTLLDAVELSEKTEEEALREGTSRFAKSKSLRVGFAYVMSGIVLLTSIYGVLMEFIG